MGKKRGRYTPPKVNQGPSVPEMIHTLRSDAAEVEFARQAAEFEVLVAATETENAAHLADPAYAVSLGLPAELPEFTINILKRTMAMDKLSHLQPNRMQVYARMGISEDVFAVAAAENAKAITRRSIGVLGPDEMVPFSYDRRGV